MGFAGALLGVCGIVILSRESRSVLVGEACLFLVVLDICMTSDYRDLFLLTWAIPSICFDRGGFLLQRLVLDWIMSSG